MTTEDWTDLRRAVAAPDVVALGAPLALARLGRDSGVTQVLEGLAEAIAEGLGWGTVVVNAYRPRHHDYEALVIHGDDAVRDALLHTTNRCEDVHARLLVPRFEQIPGAYFIPEDAGDWSDFAVFVPAHWTGERPEPWLAGDALLIELRAADGLPLGFVSVDEPTGGRRPTDVELRRLVGLADHAALAVEAARGATEARRHRRALTSLVGLSARLAEASSAEDVVRRACMTAVPDLGFARGGIWVRSGDRCELRAVVGEAVHGEFPARISVERLEALLAGEDSDDVEGSGGRLVDRGARTRIRTAPLAWRGHWFIVGLRQLDGALLGAMVLDRPHDGLKPSPHIRQELRLLADQTVAAIGFVEHRAELAHQASHDSLTGLHNRRGLEATIDRLAGLLEGVSVLLLDLDRFKAVNDRFGHGTGDRVLARFAELLRRHARESDLVVRLGGEEFCLVLPAASAVDAAGIAERLRAATPGHLGELVAGQTVSIGYATADDRHCDARTLLAGADAGLYEAKAAGRDCCRPAPD